MDRLSNDGEPEGGRAGAVVHLDGIERIRAEFMTVNVGCH
jgi:hypothetical protein